MNRINRKLGVLNYLTDRSIYPLSRQEDHFLSENYAHSEKLSWKDFVGHYGCVNAIEFSHGLGRYVASGGDDRRVLLWDVEKALSDIGRPAIMRGEHNSNIFCMAFDVQNTTILSGGNDEQVIVHDLSTGETKDVFTHEDAVYGLSPDPTNPVVFASSCDDGRVLIFDTRDSCADPFCLANYTSSMHSVMYNPVEPRLLATANAKEGVGLWDVRKPRTCLLRYGGGLVQQSCMSVRFNQRGDQIIALRRRLPPVLYKTHSSSPVCEFDHSGYYNSCTMKSICFAGDSDQYVLSGSDEFNLYMWALPDDLSERSYINSAHMVLKGHRSIVNQVRFNAANHLIISSGVEKIIKVWSPFRLPRKPSTTTNDRLHERRVYSHEEYINLVLQNGNVMSHDYSQESTEEDPRMMAFFDSLVQRELDGWSSDDSLSSNEEALYNRIMALSQSDIDSDDSLPDLGQNDNEDPAYSPFTIAFASVMASQAAEGNDRFPRLNQALENAERNYAAGTGTGNSGDNDASDTSQNQSQDVQIRSSDSETENEEASSREKLAALIKRKKQELKEAMKRRMKYPRAGIVSSDSSSSDDEDGDERKKSLGKPGTINIEIGESSKETHKGGMENWKSETVTGADKLAENNKQAQIKLQRLKDFRKRLLEYDSDSSDLDIQEKKADMDLDGNKMNTQIDEMKAELESIMNPSTSGLSVNGENEKVSFKKFKRRNTVSSDKSNETEKDSKDSINSRSSPDLGPFLQRAGTSSAVEVLRVSVEDEKGKRTGKLSSDSFSFKGKNKLKTSHRHYRESDQRKEVVKVTSGLHDSRTSDRDGRNRSHRTKSDDGHHSRHDFHKSGNNTHHGRYEKHGEHRRKEDQHKHRHSESSHGYCKSGHEHTGRRHGQSESSHGHSESSHGYSKSGHRHSESSHGYSESSHGHSESSHGYSESSHGLNESSHGYRESRISRYHAYSQSEHSYRHREHSARPEERRHNGRELFDSSTGLLPEERRHRDYKKYEKRVKRKQTYESSDSEARKEGNHNRDNYARNVAVNKMKEDRHKTHIADTEGRFSASEKGETELSGESDLTDANASNITNEKRRTNSLSQSKSEMKQQHKNDANSASHTKKDKHDKNGKGSQDRHKSDNVDKFSDHKERHKYRHDRQKGTKPDNSDTEESMSRKRHKHHHKRQSESQNSDSESNGRIDDREGKVNRQHSKIESIHRYSESDDEKDTRQTHEIGKSSGSEDSKHVSSEGKDSRKRQRHGQNEYSESNDAENSSSETDVCSKRYKRNHQKSTGERTDDEDKVTKESFSKDLKKKYSESDPDVRDIFMGKSDSEAKDISDVRFFCENCGKVRLIATNICDLKATNDSLDKRSICNCDKMLVRNGKRQCDTSNSENSKAETDFKAEIHESEDFEQFKCLIENKEESVLAGNGQMQKQLESKKLSEIDGEKPSCSRDLSEENGDILQVSKSRTLSESKNHTSDETNASSSDDLDDDVQPSNGEDQLTWLEFKRFKNRLERVRKRYKEEKHRRKMERRHSDDK